MRRRRARRAGAAVRGAASVEPVADEERVARPPPGRGLSAKILLLAVIFVLVGEVLIYVPSIARFRATYLEERIAAAHLASLALDVPHAGPLDPELEARLLEHAGVLAITLWRPSAELMLGRPGPVERVFDLRERSPALLVRDSLGTLLALEDRAIRVIGRSVREPDTTIDIILDERPLRDAMLDYSRRILELSLVLSAVVALLLFASLRRMIVRPLRRVTESLAHFRRRPEDATADRPPSRRGDEIGVVERELASMRRELRQALNQKTRLAALGAAVSQLTHDLRNILASAVLVSDRLEVSADPAVRRVAPRLVESLDRAIRLCVDTLAFARAQPVPPRLARFRLRPLIEEVAEVVTGDEPAIVWLDKVPVALEVVADRDQLFRVLLNLGRNSRQAIGEGPGEIRVEARAVGDDVVVELADTGPGIAAEVLPHLFESFSASTRADGSGLGLAICREILAAHGGTIRLLDSGPDGATFQLRLPRRRAAAEDLRTEVDRCEPSGS